MPDSVFLDGVDDKIGFGSLPASLGVGAYTVAFIVKFSSYAIWDTLLGWNSLDGGFALYNDTPQSLWAGNFAADTVVSDFQVSGTSWQLLAFGKPSGTGQSTFRRYIWDTAGWTHDPAATGGVSNQPALTAAMIGDSVAFPGQCFHGHMLIGGIWNSNLAQATVESLISGKQAWIDAAPAVGLRFDTASAISPFAGSATQTSRTGTSLAAGVAPAGWTDGAAGPPPQQVRPDADVTTTGWTTAPLYSKVDEAVADDGDFITSTAS